MIWRFLPAGLVLFASILGGATTAFAQEEHQHHAPESGTAPVIPEDREGSGTSWLPDGTPMFAVHGRTLGGWTTMLHGAAFVQYLTDEPPRGASQIGSINWMMGHVRKTGSFGSFAVRGMVSLEPATIDGCGYPDLLASGETCDGRPIVDRQHPHDLIMEAAALYTRPVNGAVGIQLYGGVAGEPALGPVAFPHRPSAVMNPVAPVSHHWLDATHITYGVFTGGVYGRRWKAEGSIFNGREPDEHRYDLDLARMDSYSGRVTLLPSPGWALQVSAGHLEEAEAHETGRVDVDRFTASAMYSRGLSEAGLLAATIAWGRNVEDGLGTNAWLLETMISMADRDVFFARAELVGKTAHDLDLHDLDDSNDPFSVGKIQVGYSRFFAPVKGWRAGLGGSVAVGVLPATVSPFYGGRAPMSAAVFLSFRPAAMGMGGMAMP